MTKIEWVSRGAKKKAIGRVKGPNGFPIYFRVVNENGWRGVRVFGLAGTMTDSVGPFKTKNECITVLEVIQALKGDSR
jgi:hypothetical protein